MNHFFITRFNLKRMYTHDKNSISVMTEDWTQKRFALFEKYCLPSIAAQTNKDFKWICLFSSDTSQYYRSKIEAYQTKVPQLMPMFFEDEQMPHLKTDLINQILDLSDKGKNIVTTRLDNDDTIHKNFVQYVQDFASRETEPDVFYTFRYGYQYFEDLNVAIKLFFFNNHFLSRVESDRENLRTVIDIQHQDVHLCGTPVKNLTDKPMWIEVVHGTNVDNDIKLTIKFRPVIKSLSFVDFGLKLRTAEFFSALSTFSTAFSFRFMRRVKMRVLQKIQMATIKAN